MASSSSSSARVWKYDVFLSFRGEDVRPNFISHLHKELNLKGIHTFKDDQRLEPGKSIGPELLKAIQDSRFCLVVFSQNYGDSSWCLDELAHMVRGAATGETTVLPLFYKVDPSHVRKQSGVFGDVFFDKHARHEKMEVWRESLKAAANLSGWTLDNGDEAKFVEEIVSKILSKLGDSYSSGDEHLVGIETHIKELGSVLSIGTSDVRILGIWGCGGIGKTTIARAIFDKFSHQFEGSSFLHNVRDTEEKHGIVHLQRTLLSEILKEENLFINNVYAGIDKIRQRLCRKQVLIVLDDVNKLNQLENLAGKRDWFGGGSRIIITTRDKHLLDFIQADKIHEVRFLKGIEAIRVFSQKAFKKHHPEKGYEELSDCFVEYAAGLPLALNVLGSALCNEDKDKWEDALDKLKRRGPGREILDTLGISYGYLDASEKDIFLDIACFFNGYEEDYVTRALDSFGFNPKIGISVLVKKSLLSRSENKLFMHDLLQELGWDIVRQESPREPGDRSRLFNLDDIKHVLTNNTGTNKIEGIQLTTTSYLGDKPNVSSSFFTKMNRLRFLQTNGFPWSFLVPEYLSNELRWLDWNFFHSESMPASFQADKLVQIKMHSSSIVQLWKGIKVLNKLKYIDLSYSYWLKETPDFTETPNLMELILFKCVDLVKVHSSLGLLEKIVVINLAYCINLQILPNSMRSKALKIFNLSDCMKLENFPEVLGYLDYFEDLDLSRTAIRELPPSIGNLTGLVRINLSCCYSLMSLPSTICMLKRLKELNLKSCRNIDRLPDSVGSLECLGSLILDGTNIVNLPESICELSRLKYLGLDQCYMLKALPKLPTSLTYLLANYCKSLETIYIDGLTVFPNLITASFNGCSRLFEDRNIGSILWLHRLQGLLNADIAYSICAPKTEIPQWFNKQNIGCSVSMRLSQYWYNHKLLGFAICFVNSNPFESSRRCNFAFKRKRHNNSGDTRQLPYTEQHISDILFIHDVKGEGFSGCVALCMAYISLSNLFSNDELDRPNDWFEVVVSFPHFHMGSRWGVESILQFDMVSDCEVHLVSRCGVRLVYEDDCKPTSCGLQLKEINQQHFI